MFHGGVRRLYTYLSGTLDKLTEILLSNVRVLAITKFLEAVYTVCTSISVGFKY